MTMAADGAGLRVPPRPSIAELAARLIADARAWVQAEIALLKCRGGTLAGALRTAVILLVVALVLASLALIALAVGLVLALATLVGPGWATAIVVVALLAAAGLCGWLGIGRIRQAFKDQS